MESTDQTGIYPASSSALTIDKKMKVYIYIYTYDRGDSDILLSIQHYRPERKKKFSDADEIKGSSNYFLIVREALKNQSYISEKHEK